MQKLNKHTRFRCPVEGCTVNSPTPMGLSAHIRGRHDGVWQGSMKKTLKKLGKDDLVMEVDGAGMARDNQPRKKQQRRHRRTTGQPGRYLPKPNGALQHAAKFVGVKHCPECGCHLEVYNEAAAFVASRGGR
jgi:hypothetical protein